MFSHNILMCRPDHYDVNYSINPWMDIEQRPDPALARRQWQELHHAVIRLGGYVHYLDPHPGLPDLVFTANGGLVLGKKVVLPTFAHEERQGEETHFARFFRDRGYDVLTLDQDHDKFEGNGDAFIFNEALYLGIGSRTNVQVAPRIMSFFNLKKLVLCELICPSLYHLDTCFCPLGGNDLLYIPAAFTPETQAALATEKLNLIPLTGEVGEVDGLNGFACNSVVLGKDVIMPAGCEEAAKRVAGRGYNVHPVAMSEFMKAGGAAKCLTLKV